jgi:hypothetical protein
MLAQTHIIVERPWSGDFRPAGHRWQVPPTHSSEFQRRESSRVAKHDIFQILRVPRHHILPVLPRSSIRRPVVHDWR